jgi:hypothetical protein
MSGSLRSHFILFPRINYLLINLWGVTTTPCIMAHGNLICNESNDNGLLFLLSLLFCFC